MNTMVPNRMIRMLLLGALLATPAAAQQLPAAKDLHDKHVKAMGGADVIKKHTMLHVTGNFEIPAQGLGGTLEIWGIAPDKMVSVQDIPGVGTIKSGYDGTVAWSINPMTGASLLTGKQVDQLKQQADLHAILDTDKYIQSMETV
jgi:hypothetical protein